MSHAHPSPEPGRHPPIRRAVPVALAVAVVALQIAYPLVAAGAARDRLTVVIVFVFAAASLAHALVWRGVRFATALLVVTAVGGLVIEAVGVSTGLPFGRYRYVGSLGVHVLGVPVTVALAWMMMAYPAHAVSAAIGGGALRRVLVAGWALAAWDLFLDPQMVQAGHWRWEPTAGPALLGIPVINHLAWFVVATAMMAALHAMTTSSAVAADDRVPLAMYCWTFASSVLAHAVFFGLPGSALTGGVGMGVVVLALTRTLRRRSGTGQTPPHLGPGRGDRATPEERGARGGRATSQRSDTHERGGNVLRQLGSRR